MKKELRSAPVGFTAPTFGGPNITFANTPGKAAMVSFFATWCTPCRDEMPSFLEIAHRYASLGLVSMLIDENESPKKLQAFVDRYHVDVPIVMDDGELINLFAFRAYPSTVFFNTRGVMTCLVQDSRDAKQLDNEAAVAVGPWMP